MLVVLGSAFVSLVEFYFLFLRFDRRDWLLSMVVGPSVGYTLGSQGSCSVMVTGVGLRKKKPSKWSLVVEMQQALMAVCSTASIELSTGSSIPRASWSDMMDEYYDYVLNKFGLARDECLVGFGLEQSDFIPNVASGHEGF